MSGARRSSRISTSATASTVPPSTATVIHYRPRSAIREVGKVFGLTEDVTAALASGVWGSWGSELKDKPGAAGQASIRTIVVDRARRRMSPTS